LQGCWIVVGYGDSEVVVVKETKVVVVEEKRKRLADEKLREGLGFSKLCTLISSPSMLGIHPFL
jgi:hypothetical protein